MFHTLRFVALLLALALPAAAEFIPRPADRARLDGNEVALGRALRQALMGGASGDVAMLAEALSGPPRVLSPEGDWACRTMKLGTISPLVVYGNFRCRITAAGPGLWRIEKLTGSQRLAGEIRQTDGGALYLGVGFVDGGPAGDYASLPPDDQTPVAPGQTVAQVGFFEQTGPSKARLMLPSPLLESDYDILYLTR